MAPPSTETIAMVAVMPLGLYTAVVNAFAVVLTVRVSVAKGVCWVVMPGHCA
jgi:hypothetical protein